MDAPSAPQMSVLVDWLALLPAVCALIILLPLAVLAWLATARTGTSARGGYSRLPDSDPAPEAISTAANNEDGAQESPEANSQGSENVSWQKLDELAQEQRPATWIETALIWLSAAAAAFQVVVAAVFVPLDRPLEFVNTAMWLSAWLCMLLLAQASCDPRSPAPRSLAAPRMLFVANEAWLLAFHIFDPPQNKDGLLLLVAHGSGLALALIILVLDLFNPPRNADEIARIRIANRAVSPETTASLWSYLTFSWIDPLLSAGHAKPLEAEDLPHIAREDQMSEVVRRWKAIRIKSNNVFWDVLRLTWQYALFQIVATVLKSILGFSTTFFVNRILTWMQSSPADENARSGGVAWGVMLLVAMFACSIVRNILDSQVGLSGRHWGIQIRSILVHEIFAKSLRRAEKSGPSKNSDNEDKGVGASQGKIVNLMSSDANQIRYFMTDIHSLLIDTPLSIIISVSGLLALMGLPALAGLFVIIISGPLSAMALKSIYKLSAQLRTCRDRRIQITNEALHGIRIIKYNAWEPQFSKRILDAREDEIKSRFKLILSYMLITFVSWCSNILVTFTSFFFYTVVAGHTLDAATAFTSITLLSIAADTLSSLSEDISFALEIKVIMNRISSFLSEEELERFSDTECDHKSKSNWPDMPQWTLYNRASPRKNDPVVGLKDAVFTHYSTTKNAIVSDASQQNQSQTESGIAEAAPLLAHAETDESHDYESHVFFLRNINVLFPTGQLTTIIGPTGAGKSSLLAALLGELRRLSGAASLQLQTPENMRRGISQSDVAYVAQTAWLMNATVRDNILFGQPYDEERYNAVVSACALTRDLATFPAGDLTEIGVQGVNLSGGQKQRVSLARAAYSKASIVLLDDPLSAVDAPTARHLFHQCILGLLRGRTILLVSHAVGLVVPLSDHIVAISNGEVLAHGTPAEIMDNPEVGMIIEHEAALETETHTHDGDDASKDKDESKKLETEAVGQDSAAGSSSNDAAAQQSRGKLTTKEEKATGSIQMQTYIIYFMYCGGFVFAAIMLFATLCKNGGDYLSNWWIERWTDTLGQAATNATKSVVAHFSSMSTLSSSSRPLPGTENADILADTTGSKSSWVHFASAPATQTTDTRIESLFYISIYGLVSLIELFGVMIRVITVTTAGIRAGRIMHAKLLESVLNSPLQFFETTPLGRIVNRFSKDIADADSTVASNLAQFSSLVLGLIFRIVLVGFVTPPFLVSTLLFFFYWRIARHYLASSREVKRIESVSSSPIYAKFSESLSGVSTIRAYGAQDRMVSRLERLVDANHRAFFYLYAANRWLSLRTSILSAAIVFIAGLSVVLSGLSAGWAGLAFNFTSSMTMMMIRLIQVHSNMEISMNSVERVQEYTKLPPEPPAIVESYRPPPGWPSTGAVVVKDLVIKYRPNLPPALKGVSFELRPREKLAVVGRTGAGKSTLSVALFRILPFVSGSIEIDGIDISRLGLRDLRSNLTVISQDPLLFEGTLRSNLDPLSMHTDAEIWEALRLTNVLESLQKPQVASEQQPLTDSPTEIVHDASSGPVAQTPAKGKAKTNSVETPSAAARTPRSGNQTLTLEAHVAEGGSNFSQGQRQLLCLARALLRSRHFIFLDEATASVDADTDAHIQETIRTHFRDATVLTVAHRLRTIIDYDRILVLDDGRVAEIGTPYELLQRNGIFASMCKQSGEMDALVQIATQCHQQREGQVASSSE